MLFLAFYFLAITTVVLLSTGTLANLDMEWAPFASAMGLLAMNCVELFRIFLI